MSQLPGVVDLQAARDKRAQPLEAVDDVETLFQEYYRDHPDQDTFEVFDE